MKITLAAFGILAALAVSGCGDDDEEGGGTGDPETACKSVMAELCAKFWGCFSDAELEAASAFVGNNEADCRTKFVQDECGEQMTKCDSGEAFSSSKASECLSQFEALSCDEFGTGNAPAACENVCE